MMDTKAIDDIIVGRVIPHIYAFSTNTIPNYLKVGDTYRTVESRLKEWKQHFPDLIKEYEAEALVDNQTYFRDYSVHKYLETEKGRKRLQPENAPSGAYYSNEFFEDAKSNDVSDGILDIKSDFENKGFKYDYYNLMLMQQVNQTFERTETYDLRPNQKETVEKFKKAIKAKRTNLLMYAVMRFGKSFTSMCCALEMNAKIVVVVSAKADVLIEWKRTVESHVKFQDYEFITSKDLTRDTGSISNCLKNDKNAVVFLTLQDLQGNAIKSKHKEIFKNKIDLLIVDETHFGARAEEYGKVLNYDQDEPIKQYKDFDDVENAKEQYKYLKRKVTLHLSGTPYRLLMSSEFKKEDVICFCQFSDIVKEQKEWDAKYLLNDVFPNDYFDATKAGKEVHEWDNPYFGFPQMVRFAFNPNESTQRRLDELKKNGVTYAFSKLLKTKSIKKVDNGDHKKFEYETEILDLLKCIDGSKSDQNVFSFLNYSKINEGKMCRHMVFVLPYCASCDALEQLIIDHKTEFNKLGEYEIINISGVDDVNKYRKTEDVKNKISECENNNHKTITLTVQRMLTGSTVKEWDTMIYLKDTSSPQEYDQAIFRLQNQYVSSIADEKTNDVVKINMKPQTLLVDFAPNRMFYMQEKKAQIYNANEDKTGNSKLKERIKDELEISPIIVINKDKLTQLEENNILDAISNYNYDKGITEEVKEVSIDLGILENEIIKSIIDNENEIDSSQGLEIKANNGAKGNLNIDDDTQEHDNNGNSNNGNENNTSTTDENNEVKKLIRKIQNYYRRILLFAFLTDDIVISLDEIIKVIDKKDNVRISKNLSITKDNLCILKKSFKNKFALSSLDYKIQDLNSLSHDNSIEENKKVKIAVSKFGKIGEATIITPNKIVDHMIDILDDDYIIENLRVNHTFLDISSVTGEFAFGLVRLFNRRGIAKENYESKIYSIPKSLICYELTRKLYKILGLDVDCISTFTSYDLVKMYDDNKDVDSIVKRIVSFKIFSKNDLSKEGKKMLKFNAVLGNPPYQRTIREATEGNNKNAEDIYPFFQDLARAIGDKTCMIYPAKDYQRGKQNLMDEHLIYFRIYNGSSRPGEKHIPNEDSVFGDAVRRIPGDVGLYLYDKTIKTSKIIYQDIEIDRTDKLLPIRKEYISIANKLTAYAGTFKFSNITKVCESNFVEHNRDKVLECLNRDDVIPEGYSKVLTNDKAGSGGKAKWYYIKTDALDKSPVDKYKIVIGSARPNEAFASRNSLIILNKDESFGRTKIAIFDSEDKNNVENCVKYLSSKFAKCINEMTPDKFLYYLPDFDFVNDKINWNDDIDAQLVRLFGLDDGEIQLINNL